MPFKKIKDRDFVIDGDRIKLTDQYKSSAKFKKITGSRIFSIFGNDHFCSPFKTWLILTGLYVEEIEPLLGKVGNIIEPKIRDLVAKQLNVKFRSFDPISVNFDVFKENPVFGGIPDGETIDESGLPVFNNNGFILEIKTTSIDKFLYKKNENGDLKLQFDEFNNPIVQEKNKKYKSWFNASNQIIIPVSYIFQLSLYLWLRNCKNGKFAICFLQTNDYVYPDNVDITKREVAIVDFTLDLDKFKIYTDYCIDWYNTYVKAGISPVMTNNDLIWLKQHLE